MRVEASGEGTVHACDIITDADVEILNPDRYCHAAASSADFHGNHGTKGRGYVSAERNNKKGTTSSG